MEYAWSLVVSRTLLMGELALLQLPMQDGSGLIAAGGFQNRFQPGHRFRSDGFVSEAIRARCSAEERGTPGVEHAVRNYALSQTMDAMGPCYRGP